MWAYVLREMGESLHKLNFSPHALGERAALYPLIDSCFSFSLSFLILSHNMYVFTVSYIVVCTSTSGVLFHNGTYAVLRDLAETTTGPDFSFLHPQLD